MMKKRDKVGKKARMLEADLYFKRTDGDLNSNAYQLQANFNAQKPAPLHHRPRAPPQNSKYGKSDLSRAFDPIKDRHMWTMWRTAVNGRIMDGVQRREQAKSETGTGVNSNVPVTSAASSSVGVSSTYGKTLSGAPPLSRFIRMDDCSKSIAQSLVKEGQGQLKTSQFIYYGLPRVVISNQHKKTTPTPDLNLHYHVKQEVSDGSYIATPKNHLSQY